MEPKLLLTPGPTPIPPEVSQAMSQGMIGHRSSDFTELMKHVQSNIGEVFGSKYPVAVLTSSGTSALETAMINLVGKDESIIIIASGAFGDRFKSIAKAHPFHVYIYEVPWGEGVNVQDFEAFLNSKSDIKAVFSQACETSTAVLHPVKEIGRAVKNYDSSTLFIVDGVSAVGGTPFNLEAQSIDCLVTGSQKALMLPPGIAFVTMNEAARVRASQNRLPRFYLDINQYFSALEKHSTPFTPAVSLIQGLDKVLSIYKEEGIDKIFDRHMKMKNMIRAGLTALDLELLVEEAYASPTVTAFKGEEAELSHIKDTLQKEYGITIAGGQKQLKGKILRIGHMGYMFPKDMLTVLAALESILTRYRNKNYYGTALTAAQEAYHESI